MLLQAVVVLTAVLNDHFARTCGQPEDFATVPDHNKKALGGGTSGGD